MKPKPWKVKRCPHIFGHTVWFLSFLFSHIEPCIVRHQRVSLHPVITSRFHLGLLTGAYLLLLGCPSCSTGNKKVIRLLKWLLWHCGRCSAVSDEAFKKQLETHLFKVAFVSPQVFLYCVLFYAFILRMLKIFSSFSSNHCWPFSVKVVLLNQCIVIIITILSNAFIYRCSNLSSYKNLVLN